MTNPKVSYCSGLAGSGKTAIIVEDAHAEAIKGRRTLIVQPTKALCDATKRRLDRFCPRPYRVLVYHSDNTANVTGTIVQTMRSEHQLGEIIITTHAAFLNLGDSWPEQTQLYSLVVDETFGNVLVGNTLQMPESHSFITDHLTDLADYKPGYSAIEFRQDNVKHLKFIKKIAKNSYGDQLYQQVQHLAANVANPSFEVHVEDDSYLRMMREDRTQKTNVYYFAQLKPAVLIDPGWRDVMVYSACFEESLMYLLWQDRIDWVEAGDEVNNRLTYRDAHPGGEKTTIYYCAAGNWSKRYRDTLIEGDDAFLQKQNDDGSTRQLTYGEFFFKMISNMTAPHVNELVWLRNKDQDSDDLAFGPDVRCQEMPACPHGLNDYMEMPWCCVTAAYNPPNYIYGYLAAHGIDSDATRKAIYFANVYQAVMRSAVRDPEFAGGRYLIVMDKSAADYLGDLIPGATISPLPGCEFTQKARKSVGRKKEHASAAARKAACVARAIGKDIKEIESLVGTAAPMVAFNGMLSRDLDEYFVDRVIDFVAAGGKEASNGTNYNNTGYVTTTPAGYPYQFLDDVDESANDGSAEALLSNAQNFIMPVYRSAKQSSLGYGGVEVRWRSHDGFIHMLKRWSETEFCASKAAMPLFGHAYFGPMTDPSYRRTADTAQFVYGVVIDVDDGRQFKPCDLADIFPRIRIATYSTHGSTPAHPKWRAWIPTTHLMSPALYKKLCDLIERKLNAAGFWYPDQITSRIKKDPKVHGIDAGKFGSASSIYYMPSSPIGGVPEFHGFDDDHRAPLNVIMWLKDACLHTRAEEDTSEAAKGLRSTLDGIERRSRLPTGMINKPAVERAVEAWQQARSGAGDRYFYTLACRLMDAGMSYDEVEEKLQEQYVYAARGSIDDRRRQIPRIMTSLRKSGTWAR